MPVPRPQAVAIPILRDALPNTVTVGSWIRDVDDRTYPIVNIRQLGGRDSQWVAELKLPVIELTVYTSDMLESAETLANQCLDILEDAVYKQTIVPGVGYFHSMFVTFPPGQFDSEFDDTWRVQTLIQLGVRPPA